MSKNMRYGIAIHNATTTDVFNFETEEEMLNWKEKHLVPGTIYDEIDRVDGVSDE